MIELMLAAVDDSTGEGSINDQLYQRSIAEFLETVSQVSSKKVSL
jgi:hypothetical protein